MANKLADECKTLNIRCLSTFNCAFLLLMGILSNSKNIEVNCESYFCQTNTDIMDVKLQVCGLLVHIVQERLITNIPLKNDMNQKEFTHVFAMVFKKGDQ
jgi:hypothetical protein